MGLGDVLRSTMPIICGPCSEELERRFARPACSNDRETLGDRLRVAHKAWTLSLLEQTDPDVAEVFPSLSKALSLPKGSRADQRIDGIKPALARVGKPVCITVPEGLDDLEVPFLMMLFNEVGGFCDWRSRIGMRSPTRPNASTDTPTGPTDRRSTSRRMNVRARHVDRQAATPAVSSTALLGLWARASVRRLHW